MRANQIAKSSKSGDILSPRSLRQALVRLTQNVRFAYAINDRLTPAQSASRLFL